MAPRDFTTAQKIVTLPQKRRVQMVDLSQAWYALKKIKNPKLGTVQPVDRFGGDDVIDGRITKNFSLWEMMNKQATESTKLVLTPEVAEFAQMMQELRDWYGKPLEVSSWYRTRNSMLRFTVLRQTPSTLTAERVTSATSRKPLSRLHHCMASDMLYSRQNRWCRLL